MAALPPVTHKAPTIQGAAGRRLQERHTTNLSEDLLKEYARDDLGAQRISEKYLDALRIVLGNQAHALRYGYDVEMNQRVSFATPKVMRTIVDQMAAAGISQGKAVGLGNGRRQVIQCFSGNQERQPLAWSGDPAEELERMYRSREAEDRYDLTRHPSIQDDDIPS